MTKPESSLVHRQYKGLIRLLRANGYHVCDRIVHVFGRSYRFAAVSGRGIRGGFCKPNEHSYSWLSGYLCVDNARCYDKWSKCPLRVPLDCDASDLLRWLRILGSDEGFAHSNSYAYLEQPTVPRAEINGAR